jgi:acyl-coenzyme A thioesterase PaaI-like protein
VSLDPDLAAVFATHLDGLEEQRWPGREANPFQRCFGCGPGHPTGLHVRCFKTDGGVLSPILISRVYEGPPGMAHGGIIAAYLDEICGAAVLATTGRMTITGELTVRFVRPVPIESPILGRGGFVKGHGKYVDVEARLEDPETGEILATARGRFFDYRA